MKPVPRLAAVLSLALLTSVGVALGDGGMFLRGASNKDILQPTQKVYIRWDGSQERLLVQTKYQGPAEEMVWMVPVPSKPAVELGDGTVFESLSQETAYLDVSYTDFVGLHRSTARAASRGGTSPVEWREQIGEYDVVLLRPVGEEDVVQWLQSNEFAIPEAIIPVLNDYVRNEWWMVVSKIHPDALTNITREKLAQGLLHPLEMTFESSACVYPMRLTSMAGGPVEELIYIEGPAHYEPATLAGGAWEISIFGGPIRQVPDSASLSDLEVAIRTRDGKTETTLKRHLTKLRRVFQPSEMTEDLVFRSLDYAAWLASPNLTWIAQAATQYGRKRDPNGIPHLLAVLSEEALQQAEPAPGDYSIALPPSAKSLSWEAIDKYTVSCRHLRSCIWALGEIGIEHETGASVEEALLYCARHDNQLIRVEASIALIKLGSPRIGSVFADRVAQVLPPESTPWEPFWYDGTVLAAEMETVIDWIVQFGTTVERDVLVAGLAETILHLPTESEFYVLTWPEWVIEQAAKLEDTRLVPPLDRLLGAIPSNYGWTKTLLLAAEMACGSREAAEPFTRDLLEKEDQVLTNGTPTDGSGLGSLYGYYNPRVVVRPYRTSLRVQILQKPKYEYKSEVDVLSPHVADAIVRQAIDRDESTDWYILYLLALIQQPKAEDQDRLTKVLNRCESSARVVAADVLYVWGDTHALLDLYGKAGFADLKSETAWSLAALRCEEAVAAVQEQLWGHWNTEIAAVGTTFVDPGTLSFQVGADPCVADAVRKSVTLWNYFRPQEEEGALSQERLELLKRIGGDSTIHPGTRYLLIGSDYGGTDWGRPLLERAVRDILATDLSPSTVRQVCFTMACAGDSEFIANLCREAANDEFRMSILSGLLSDRSGLLSLISTLLGEVWPEQYAKTNGQSLLFRAPGDLSAEIDFYSHNKRLEDLLETLVKNDSLPPGYRAFLLVNWPKAPSRVSKELAESLLQADMPDFIHEALQKRLLNWQ
jgi:hypothetical protein